MSGEEETHSVWGQDEEEVIDHVIFVIHGIGQQTERFGYFEQHMETIRKTICEVLDARMPNRDIRIQLIPIEWHKHIHEETDDCLNNISLSTIPGMRLISNDYMMDALYYLAKDRQQSIVTHVTRCFNDSYHEFMGAHPTFNGNIGIFGYSLGGLITWDILAHQRPVLTVEEQAQLNKLNLNVPRLDFKPQFLFGVGCPLGGFLNIRNQDPKLYHPDSSTIFENIYHPYDPLAYRVEPLYHPDCRHHNSIQVETAIKTDPTTPLISSLTGWVTSWFKKSNDDSMSSCTPQPSPAIINNQHPLATNNTDYTGYSPSSPAVSPSSDVVMDCFDDMNEVTGDRTTLLSSVGALFQYISPRASFDRDSAIGSDIEEEEEDYDYEDEAINSSDNDTTTDIKNKKKKKNAIHPVTSMNNPPPGVAAANVTNPMNDPNMMYRRRQSQIYDTSVTSFSIQKKRRQSLPNFHSIHASSSSLEKDQLLLQTLPGSRRVDFALQPGPLLGGMISNQYLLGLQAHFSYWNNKDMLWRMVSQLDNAIH
ncbi:DDHD domain-containing protein [Chlamydoabsidia padenii]|nr:DDHD domain-containing protein [Chlamydoabsidia padenii]